MRTRTPYPATITYTATIELGNFRDEEQAREIRRTLQGETYMSFFVDFSPGAGNWPVSVSTARKDTTPAELLGMVAFFLASRI